MINYERFSELREICFRANEQKWKTLYWKDKEKFKSFEMSHLRNKLYNEYLIRFFWYGKNKYSHDEGWFLISDWEYKINFLEKIIFEFDTNKVKLVWIENQLNFRLEILSKTLDNYLDKVDFLTITNRELLIKETANFDECHHEIKLIRKAMELINYYHNPQPLPTSLMLSPTMSAPEGAMMLSPNDKLYKQFHSKKK
jgi:hypothetical protein